MRIGRVPSTLAALALVATVLGTPAAAVVPPPTAVITPPTQSVQRGETVFLVGSGSFGAFPLGFSWIRLSGPTVTLAPVAGTNGAAQSFVAAAAGTYVFRLAVTDAFGQMGSAETTITVSDVQRPSVIVHLGQPVTGAQAIFEAAPFFRDGSFSGPPSSTYAATVDYGDGAGIGSLALRGTSFTLAHTYLDNGAFTISVAVADGEGDRGTGALSVAVLNRQPDATINAVPSQVWGRAVTLSGSATDPSPVDQAAGFDVVWGFGDGSPQVSGHNLFSTTHSYAVPGTYSASLQVADKDGGRDAKTTIVEITRRPATLACVGGTTTFGFAAVSVLLGDALAGARLGDHSVRISVNGVAADAPTDASGVATLRLPPFPPLAPGAYTVNVTLAADDPLYVAPSAMCGLAVVNTEGGRADGDDLRSAIGDVAGGFEVKVEKGRVRGELALRIGGLKFKAEELTALGISADGAQAAFAGVSRDGREFVAFVEDNDPHGKPESEKRPPRDRFKLWVQGVLQTGDGTLTKGDVEVRLPKRS